jgi:hypothetical protein
VIRAQERARYAANPEVFIERQRVRYYARYDSDLVWRIGYLLRKAARSRRATIERRRARLVAEQQQDWNRERRERHKHEENEDRYPDVVDQRVGA